MLCLSSNRSCTNLVVVVATTITDSTIIRSSGNGTDLIDIFDLVVGGATIIAVIVIAIIAMVISKIIWNPKQVQCNQEVRPHGST